MDGPSKPPQISDMFQKFALAFKTKTFEFFADEDATAAAAAAEDSDDFFLLDSAEEIITDQKVVVIKPDSALDFPSETPPSPQAPEPVVEPQLKKEEEKTEKPSSPSPPLVETKSANQRQIRAIDSNLIHALVSSIFATVASFEASYFQLQTAHVPFVEENVKAADRVLVSQLQRLSELKKFYKNSRSSPDFDSNFPFGSFLEAQVEENQSKLRTLGTVSNRLQLELEQKHDEVSRLRRKLDEIYKSNVKLSKKLCGNLKSSSDEVLFTVRVFDSVLHDASRATHKFTKILISLMRKAGWDLDLVANTVHPNIGYAKKGHSQYALLSYVCLGMFQSFDSQEFGIRENSEEKNSCLKQLLEHVSSNPMELLSIHPTCDFSKFCELKYERLIHPTMESSIFVNLDQNEVVLNSWRSLSMFYEAFVTMASSIWTLHKLSHAFDPTVEIFQVERGVEFSMVYMEDVTRRFTWRSKSKAKVGFTVLPGFKIGGTIIQSQVYLSNFECTE
ncbi:protein GRAVITROPIC IN THE LIGHT 1-like [Senna tora]|uniref:Protein GRAVITROPIC IN THE LIGHT 1-like n=1 Tax=Senna tora TaxID=362788 RepID=A0A835CIU8_9FABA|nr:protein GRAVITROPIC IN THE LIGHT 1-like [Senna tora]